MSRPPHHEEFANQAERSRRIADLKDAPALPLSDVALLLDLPLATLDKMRQEGKGPRMFKLGRRLYVKKEHLYQWLEQMAEIEA